MSTFRERIIFTCILVFLGTSKNSLGFVQTAGIYGTAWESIIAPTNKIVTVGSGIGLGPGGFTRFDIRRYNSDGFLDNWHRIK
ncbi:MAG: hypothetical protein SH817_00555 [Leptospira sp.]|nr:hypothetical protein [Leptospira sp.]